MAIATTTELCSPLIQEAANKIVNEMGNRSNPVDRIYPMSMFRIEAGNVLKSPNGLTKNDLHIILTYLARDKSSIVHDAEVS